MNDWPVYLLSFMAGSILGLFFFGMLWLTVKKSLNARQPAIWFSLSLLIRLVVTVAGFYFVSGQQWQRLLLMMAGFVITRSLLILLTKKQENLPTEGGDTDHEPDA